MNAFGMSHVATCLPSWASIIPVRNKASVLTVGLDESSFPIQARWVLPLDTVLALTWPDFFSARNTKDSVAFFFSVLDSSNAEMGAKHSRS